MNERCGTLIFVFDVIVVGLKVLKELCNYHEAQLFYYMRITRKPRNLAFD